MQEIIPRVLVAAMLSEPAGQRKFAGIFAYLGTVRRWNLRILRTQQEAIEAFKDKAAIDCMDGVIYSAGYDHDTFKALAALKCPVVVMENESPELSRRTKNLVVIRNDADEIARAALRHFAEMGQYRSFAFVSDRHGHEWSRRREKAFRKAVAENGGGELHVYGAHRLSNEIDCGRLAKFLSELDYPAAVMAANDIRATEIIAAAKDARLPIPGKVAVLGIDNDPYVCDSVSPSISSIEPDFHAEGAAAAELLDKMMHSRTPNRIRHLFFGVKRILTRESTPHLPPSESLVARAHEFIEKHATDGIAPNDVAEHLGISRPLLDLRFRQTQKTSVGRLITATKLNEVARQLRETHLSIDAIQELCGFKNANALKNLFKARFGCAMRDYRRLSRAQ